jgi:hypothetical protein
VIFFGIVFLHDNQAVRDTRALVQRVSEWFGLDSAVLLEIGRARAGEIKVSRTEMEKLFFDYLDDLARLAEKVDKI